jgi:hypothetical protein
MDRYFTEHWHEELRHEVRAFAERKIEPRIQYRIWRHPVPFPMSCPG